LSRTATVWGSIPNFSAISDTVNPFISFISDILQKNLEKVNYFSHFLLTKCEYWFTLISRDEQSALPSGCAWFSQRL
jgi:hypothetical protein